MFFYDFVLIIISILFFHLQDGWCVDDGDATVPGTHSQAGTDPTKQVQHIINKRHKGRQMSSLYFWLILHSISAVVEELF